MHGYVLCACAFITSRVCVCIVQDARLEELIPPFDTLHFPTVLSDQDLPPASTTPSQSSSSQSPAAAPAPPPSPFESDATVLPRDHPMGAAASATGTGSEESWAAATLRHLERVRDVLGRGRASNNWVVSGNLTASGKPFLANDPHLMLTAPSVWLLFDLHW